LGLSGIQRTTVIVRDLDAAIARYGDGLGLETSVPIEDADRGLRIAIARAPKGGVVELATVTNPNAVEALAPNKVQSEGMVALTLEARDLDGTANALRKRGLSVERRGDVLLLDSSQTFGTLFRIVSSA
jgi:catechol 2,3-dioxygenase-like lactoylglutathione lyase family enzyme